MSASMAPAHASCRLSVRQVRDIRAHYKPGVPGHSCRALGVIYGVSHVAIWKVVKDLKAAPREAVHEIAC